MKIAIVILCFFIVIFRMVEVVRYREFSLLEKCLIKNNTFALIKKHDAWILFFTMTYVWLEIALFFIVGNLLPVWASVPLVAILVAGRFRALQEIAHTALHFGFGPNRKLQWKISDWMGNYWIFKANSVTRYKGHCVEHHPNANTENDPNIVRLRAIGFAPNMSLAKFQKYLFHPLTVFGFKETLSLYASAAGKGTEIWVRLFLTSAVIFSLSLTFGNWALVSWILALVVFYPLYSWWSLLAEHRWFSPTTLSSTKVNKQTGAAVALTVAIPAEQNSSQSRIAFARMLNDCESTSRTEYSGLSGFFITYLISPCTDSKHLAHHLYPSLHWKYLKIADNYLVKTNPEYSKHTVTSIFGSDFHSIIYNLKVVMTQFVSKENYNIKDKEYDIRITS